MRDLHKTQKSNSPTFSDTSAGSLAPPASPYFPKMIRGGFKEEATKEIKIRGVDFDTLSAIKEYVEAGQISITDSEINR